MEIVRNHLKV